MKPDRKLDTLKELRRHRKTLLSMLEPCSETDTWPADMLSEHKASIRRELADIDTEIAERTGESLPPSDEPNP